MLRCAYCRCRVYKKWPPHHSLRKTKDHVFPRKEFPEYRGQPGNTVRACQGCNNKKADMHPFRWAMQLDQFAFGFLLEQFRKIGVPEFCVRSLRKQRRAMISDDTTT